MTVPPVYPQTAELSLSNGGTTLIDAADYALLSQYRWKLHARGYVVGVGPMRNVRLHRFLMGEPKDREVDHRDGDTLNNTRANLRVCTDKENSRNRRVKHYTTGFKGVVWNARAGNFGARIGVDYKQIHLGTFKTPIAAAKAYNAAAIEHFGEFARLNEIPSPLPHHLRLLTALATAERRLGRRRNMRAKAVGTLRVCRRKQFIDQWTAAIERRTMLEQEARILRDRILSLLQSEGLTRIASSRERRAKVTRGEKDRASARAYYARNRDELCAKARERDAKVREWAE